MMHDLEKLEAKKPEKTFDPGEAVPMEFRLPYLSLTADQLPEVKDMAVGSRKLLTIEVRVTGQSEHKKEFGDKRVVFRTELEITKIGLDEGGKK